jgi:hypothetical protein
MIRFIPCEEWHFDKIEPQAMQESEKEFSLSRAAIPDLVQNSFALSCWLDDQCIGAAGFRPIWEGRAAVWALVGKQAGAAMIPITRKLRFFLATCPVNRIEMTVRERFVPGCRLALLLGFRLEATLPGFFPDGSTAYLFTRLKHV